MNCPPARATSSAPTSGANSGSPAIPALITSARVRPKFTLFPDDPDAGLEKDRIERRPKEYHEQVRRNYLAQAEQMPERYRVVNADRSPAAVHAEVMRHMLALA